MSWRLIHRWLGLVAGTVALLVGITGALLALDPVRDAWNSTPAKADLPVATLVQRIAATIPAAEEVKRLPSGDIVVYAFANDRAQALRVDPADGRVLGEYRTSAFSRWVRNLHRSFLLGDAGRIAAAGVALAMFALSASGLVLLVHRMGGWRRLGARARGSLVQRLHVVSARATVAVLLLASATALYMSAATFELIPSGADFEPDVVSVAGSTPDLPPQRLPLLQQLRVADLRKLSFPGAADPADAWSVTTAQGRGWIDRRSGRTLAWQPAPTSQRIHDAVMVLHTGEGAWAWAAVLGLAAAGIPLFWATGLMLWWRARRSAPKIAHNSALRDAEMLVFVASENGSTWGFARSLHDALVRQGHRVHTAALEHFQVGASARRVFVLAATYGDGQPPAHAARALQRIAAAPAGSVAVSVLGFGDRQFPAFCAYAQALDDALRANGWAQLLPLERIHQQSAQQFAQWGHALAQALGETLTLDYAPRVPPTTALRLLSRQDYLGADGEPAAILRFAWPKTSRLDRLLGRGFARFDGGDLIGIVPPGSAVPRYYSLASGCDDGFVEICVRKLEGGLCSTHLHGLQPADTVQAFVRENPGFALERVRKPVVLIGAGTGVAPLAGFIRRNARRAPMHLYFGARDPARDFYFRREIEGWLREGRLASLKTVFSRIPGGGYVQDELRRDARRVRELVAKGAVVRVCGSRPMARGVAEALDAILATIGLTVRQLQSAGRYAEDVF